MLDDLGRRVQVNQTLVDSHLELVEGFGTVTTRRLTGGDAKDLGRKADGTLNLKLLILSTLDKISRDCFSSYIILVSKLNFFWGGSKSSLTLFKVLDVAGSQGDSDTVNPIKKKYNRERLGGGKEYR